MRPWEGKNNSQINIPGTGCQTASTAIYSDTSGIQPGGIAVDFMPGIRWVIRRAERGGAA